MGVWGGGGRLLILLLAGSKDLMLLLLRDAVASDLASVENRPDITVMVDWS